MGTPDADIDDWGLVVAGPEEAGDEEGLAGDEEGLAGDELLSEASVGEGAVGVGLLDEELVGRFGDGEALFPVTERAGAGPASGVASEQPAAAPPSSVAAASTAGIRRIAAPALVGVSGFASRNAERRAQRTGDRA